MNDFIKIVTFGLIMVLAVRMYLIEAPKIFWEIEEKNKKTSGIINKKSHN